MTRHWLSLLVPALTAAALHAILLGAYVAAFGGDVAALVCVGTNRAGVYPYEHIHTTFGPNGYDGQFYYAIVRAPFARQTAIDYPEKRQLRIFYPLLCWALSGGDPRVLLWVMPLVNLGAIAGLAWLGAVAARRQGFNPWWGVLLPFALNAALPALRDLTDAVSTCALAALLVAWWLRQPWWVMLLCAAAAVFSREQNTAVVAIVLGCAAWRRQWTTCAALAAVLVLWLAWAALLWHVYQQVPLLSAEGNFGRPFVSLYDALANFGDDRRMRWRNRLCLALLAFQTLLALDLLRRPADAALRLTGLFSIGLIAVGGPLIFEDPWSYARVYASLPLVVWLGCVQTRRRWPLPLLAAYVLVLVDIVFVECRGIGW